MSSQNNFLMITSVNAQPTDDSTVDQEIVKRSDFPEEFVFGASTAAYQIEGAWNIGGKGMSNWDAFTLNTPAGVLKGYNGCDAIDHYNQFREDVKLIKKLGVKSYRFSIAWTRILPGGKLSKGKSQEGIKFYNDLIDALLAEGIEPCVTLFHWDTPQCLEEEYQGFLSDKIVQDFCQFVEICFWEFGDRVKMWITLNEPWSYTVQGYVTGAFPPNRGAPPKTLTELSNRTLLMRSAPMTRVVTPTGVRSAPIALLVTPTDGNPGTEPYIVAHNLILCHAYAADIYRKRYQGYQRGKIGVTNCSAFYEPLTNTPEDRQASKRSLDFCLGWFVEPLITGDYPESMIKNVGNRLPKFTEDQEKLVKGSYDFLGINNYTTNYVSNDTKTSDYDSYLTDVGAVFSSKRNGEPIGVQSTGSKWLYVVPWGIYKLMKFIQETYDNPIVYITENGMDEANLTDKSVPECLGDKFRINYYREYLYNVHKAMKEGANIKGYYIWSLFDNFEWTNGYDSRFGVYFVDYLNGVYTRHPKSSAIWWRNFLTWPEPAKVVADQKNAEGTEERRKRIRSS